MTPHPYLYEKWIATHHAQIRHDIQLSRMYPHTEKSPTLVQYAVGKFGSLLIEWGSHLQRTGQRSNVPLHSS